MISLKKSDKIIAIVGVIILIIAGVGIALYTSEDTDNVKKEKKEEYTFQIMTEEVTKPIYPDNTNYVVKDKILGQQPYTGTVDVKGSNIKSITFKFDYMDDITGFLFKRLGRDTVTIKVTDQYDTEISKGSITGSGNLTIKDNIGSRLRLEKIVANSTENATKKLKEKTENYELSYNIKVTLDVKETWLRPWKWIREKVFSGGDKFQLEVEYTNYDYTLQQMEETMNDNNPDENKDENIEESYSPLSGIVNTGYGSGKLWL